jgi:hypothetical protein
MKFLSVREYKEHERRHARRHIEEYCVSQGGHKWSFWSRVRSNAISGHWYVHLTRRCLMCDKIDTRLVEEGDQ